MSDEVTPFDPFDPHAFVPGSTVGPWLIQERMDRGNFGIVYRARRAGHPDSPPVAVKMARQPRDPRFEREVELLQHNLHSSIPRFEDAGLWTCPEGGCYPYVVMELVEGFTLYDWFRAQQRTSCDVLQVLAQVAGALMVTGLYLPPLSEGGEVAATREVPRPSDYATLSRELEALILRLLSNAREQRGTAEVLAREAALLAIAEGEAAGMLILPTASAQLTDRRRSSPDGRNNSDVLSSTDGATPSSGSAPAEEECRHHRELHVPSWLSWASAAVVGGLLVLFGAQLHRTVSEQEPAPPWIATPEEVTQFVPDAGVGEEALSAVQDVPRTILPSMMSLGRPMPSKPFPGQKKPPCEPELEIAVLGACWAVFKKEPPCGSGAYEFDGLCVRPVIPAPRQPTSEEP